MVAQEDQTPYLERLIGLLETQNRILFELLQQTNPPTRPRFYNARIASTDYKSIGEFDTDVVFWALTNKGGSLLRYSFTNRDDGQENLLFPLSRISEQTRPPAMYIRLDDDGGAPADVTLETWSYAEISKAGIAEQPLIPGPGERSKRQQGTAFSGVQQGVAADPAKGPVGGGSDAATESRNRRLERAGKRRRTPRGDQ